MFCNPDKCKELTFVKSGTIQNFVEIAGIPQVEKLVLSGVTFQSNIRFSIHVKNKLIRANKSIYYVLRTLRRDRYEQPEIDYLFNFIIMPKLCMGFRYKGRLMLN